MNLDGGPHEVARMTALVPEFTLGAGRYRVEASIGSLNVQASQDVELEPSGSRRLSFKLDSNTLSLKFTGTALSAGLAWELRDSQSRVLMRSNQPNPMMIVAPGRYSARLDVQDKRMEKAVDVTADGIPRVIEFAQP
jgi:hypothetical protein